MGIGCNIIHHVAAFAQVALAVAVAVIVGVKLYKIDVTGADTSTTCLLGEDYDNESLCIYVFAVVGVSVVTSLLISLLQCCTCRLCGLGGILDTIFAAVGTLWWIAASIVVTKKSSDSHLPEDYWRDATVGLMWATMAAFAISLITGLIRPCLSRD